MNKKKSYSRMNTEKDLAKLINEMNKQEFNSIDELNAYMNNLMETPLDDLPKKTDKKEIAQDLVYEAYEQSATKGKKLVKQALELDPNNAEAYNYLARLEKNIEKAIILYEKAILAGEKSLGKKIFKEDKGHFWGILETRPYMRAKAGLADCLCAQQEFDKAIAIYEYMLELNPNDNLGIRYLLSTLLLSKNKLNKFEKFIKTYDDEDCAVWNFNNALYNFKKSGPTSKSKKILSQAYDSNNFVIDYLLGFKKMPEKLPQYIGLGDENEAISYVNGAWSIWDKTNNALDWIYEFSNK